MRFWPDMPMMASAKGYRFEPGKWHVVVVAKTRYVLKPGVCEELPGPMEAWVKAVQFSGDVPEADPAAGLTYPSDHSPSKTKADVLFDGSAHAPGGEPVAGLRCRFRVGPVDKSIDVVGDRVWGKSDETRGDIEPFTEMPIVWERAFGGPGDAKNPAGRGRRGEAMPNLEVVDKPVLTREALTPPACLAPINPAWKPRCDKLGSYGGDYVKKRFPWLPADFDWTHFDCAPEDQQVEGFLRGDEEIELRNLHKAHAELKTALPGERLRAFLLERLPDGGERFFEVKLVLDTVVVQPEEGEDGMVSVVWRGQEEGPSLKLEEIEHFMVIREPLGMADRGLSWFRKELDRRIENPMEMFLDTETQETIDRVMAKAEVEKEKALEQAEQAKVDAKAAIDKARETNPEVPEVDLDAVAKEPPKPRFEMVNSAVNGIDRGIAALRAAGMAADAEKIVDLETKRADLESKRRVLRAEYPRPTRAELEAAARDGVVMAYRDMESVDLSGAALDGIDLRYGLMMNTNFAGASLRGAHLASGLKLGEVEEGSSASPDIDSLLVGANLSNADLRDAELTGAMAPEVTWAGADLRGARAEGVLFVEADLAGCAFTGATLHRAIMLGVQAQGLDFDGVHGEDLIAVNGHFQGASFAEAELKQSLWHDAEVEGASFFCADMRKATLTSIKAKAACFVAADLCGAAAGPASDFAEADLRLLNGKGTSFIGATLDDAWMGGADLTKVIMSGASLRGTELVAVHSPESDWSDTTLEDADMTAMNAFRAMFDRAKMTRVRLEDAKLFQAGFCETEFDTLWMGHTDIRRTTLEDET